MQATTVKVFRQRADFWNAPRDPKTDVPLEELIATIPADDQITLQSVADDYAARNPGYLVYVRRGSSVGTLSASAGPT